MWTKLGAGILVLAVACASCAVPSSGRRLCPDSRAFGCLSGEECDYDAERDCHVCACAEPITPAERDPFEDDAP